MSESRPPLDPGETAARGRRVWPAALACLSAALASGTAMKFMLERPEFSGNGDAPALGGTLTVAFSLAATSTAAWFMRTTLLELAFDFRRRQRNMRPLLRATGWIGAGAGMATAAWGTVVCLGAVRGLGVILLPLPAIWSVRAACEGFAAARLYGKPLLLAVLLSVVAGGASMLVAFVALCSLESGYGRVVEAFRG